jgi:saxitoxin biosynthesis operon SxtJ-like protein
MASSPGLHEDFTREEQVKGSSDRAFGLTFAAVFVLFSVWPLVRHRPMRLWALGVAAIFLAVALLQPRLLGPLNRLWLRFGMVMQRVVTLAVMTLLFYATVTPVALLLRLLGKDVLNLKLDGAASTYWIERRPRGPAPDTMRHQF